MSNPGIPKSITEKLEALEAAQTELEEDVKKLEEKESSGLKVGNYSNPRSVPEHEEVEISGTKDALVIIYVSATKENEQFEIQPNFGSGGGAITWRSNSGTAEHPQGEIITFVLPAGKKYRWTQGNASISMVEQHAIID